MPWQLEAMKGVAGCDKPRGAVEQAVIRGFPNGATHWAEGSVSVAESIGHRGEPGEVKHLSTQRKRNQQMK